MDAVVDAQSVAKPRSHVLYGRRTMLFPAEPRDLPQMGQLCRRDAKGYLMQLSLGEMSEEEVTRYLAMLLGSGQLVGWSVYAKEGRRSHCIGFVYLTDLSTHSATMGGMMDVRAVRRLGRQARQHQTYAEDAARAVVGHAFQVLGLHRLETLVRADNARALALDERVGWKVEGRLRGAAVHGGSVYDVVVLGLLRKEWAG